MESTSLAVVSDGHGILKVSGTLNDDSVEDFRRNVLAARTSLVRPVHVDMAAVDHVDSAGLRCMLNLRAEDVNLRIVRASPMVQHVLELTGIGCLFNIESTTPRQVSRSARAKLRYFLRHRSR